MKKIELVHEFELEPYIKVQISVLLKTCFPEEDFNSRTYFKQHPHSRLLLMDGKNLIGQLCLDYRVMNLNDEPIHILGLIDLTIFPEYQGQGNATLLLNYVNELACSWKNNIDFLFLYSDLPNFYEKFGFCSTSAYVQWLTMENHVNYGLKKEYLDAGLMYKQIGQKRWPEKAQLDLLGYFY